MLNARTLLMAALLSATILSPSAWAVDTTKDELNELQHRVDLDPKNPDTHFDLAMGLARTVKLETGYAELQKVAALDPTYADKVIAKYKPLVEQNKMNTEAYFRLAFGYYFKGLNLKQSADTLAQTDKTKADAQYAESNRNKMLARDTFEAIITNDPKDVWGYNYLGYLVAEGGDINKSIDLWHQSLKVEDNAVAHFLLGQAFLRQNDMKDAIPELATAMRMRGLNP